MGLYQVSDRSPSGGPALEEGEELVRETKATLLVGENDCGMGSIYITTRRISWFPSANGAPGYECTFTDVTMHAISRRVRFLLGRYPARPWRRILRDA